MAHSSLVEITGKYIRERHRFSNDTGDVIVGDINCQPGMEADESNLTSKIPSGNISIKGPAEMGQLTTGIHYRWFGRWTKYKGENQFSFNTFVELAPIDRDSVIAYLSSHGAGHGLGKVRASKLWEEFGQDAVRIARTEPQRISDFLSRSGFRFKLDNATAMSLTLAANELTENIKLDLTTLLGGRGFPKSIVDTITQEWGNCGAKIVRRNPYRLLKFAGCGFKRCDAMYLDLGLNPVRLKRQALCAWYSLEQNTDGHTWYGWKVPAAYLKANISAAGVDFEKAMELGTRSHHLDELQTVGESGPISQGGDVRWFANARHAKNERDIAEVIVRAGSDPHTWPSLKKLKLSPHQVEKAGDALKSSICVLGGSPGTGKTWVVSELVKALADKVGLSNILVGAPTGKAAVRVTENLQDKGIDLRARTWHSLLMQVEMNYEKTGNPYFQAKVLIGDESSMIDTDLMASIMRARSSGTAMLLVGDVNQLPPVGHGAPLRDMIAAGVCYGELTEIVRNSGGIVEACASIRDCKPWSVGDNLHLVEAKPDMAVERILQICHQAKNAGLDPVWDVQIVTAVNEKSPLSRVELNKELQRVLNKQPGVEGVTFRPGDKLVNTKNAFFKQAAGNGSSSLDDSDSGVDSNQRDELYVANGELAKVIDVDRRSMILSLDAPARRIQVYFGQEGGCTFELGYALSVHKSQGSDWPWVVVMLDDYPGARMVCDRSWLYTAISRAKTKCWMIGSKATANRMVKTSKIWHRKTFLRELILRGKAVNELANV